MFAVTVLVFTQEVLPLFLVVAIALGIGLGVSRLLKLTLPLSLSLALGWGALAIIILMLGSAGVTGRYPVLAAIICIGAMGGWFGRQQRSNQNSNRKIAPFDAVWLVLVAVIALTLMATLLPPGLLWSGEGRGYDEMEYHLQAPKEYLQSGRIHFLRHNVYGSFPANIEMLYLLAMVIKGTPISGIYLAKLINLAVSLTAVLVVVQCGSLFNRTVAAIAALLFITTPWWMYLSSIAYNESGLWLFGAAAMWVVVRAYLRDKSIEQREAVLAGIFLGLAIGCKYTAVFMWVGPLLAVVWIGSRKGLARSILMGVAALLVFSPWCMKNLSATRNPVFPLAQSIFGRAEHWNPPQLERWQRGHQSKPEHRSLDARSGFLWSEVLFHPQGRILVGLLVVGAIATARRPSLWPVAAIIAMQITGWCLFTFLASAGRFATPIWIPATVLAASTLSVFSNRAAKISLMVILVAFIITNLTHTFQIFWKEMPRNASGDLLAVQGMHELLSTGDTGEDPFNTAQFVNRLDQDTKTLLVGSATPLYIQRPVIYNTVFDRNLLAEQFANKDDSAALQWLRKQNITHIAVDWREVERLRSTYGIDAEITRDRFAGLETAGLKLINTFTFEGRVWAEIYAVPETR